MALNNIVYSVSSLVCHQHPERCFIIGGRILPLCARCSGIYAGFMVFFLFLWITAARKRFVDYDRRVYICSGIILVLFLTEGFLSFMHAVYAGNNIRFLSGLFGGASLGIFSFRLISGYRSEKKYFIGTKLKVKDFLPGILIILALFVLKVFVNVPFAFYLWSILSFGGLLFIYAAVNLAVVATFAGTGKRKISRIRLALYTSCLVLLEFLILYLING